MARPRAHAPEPDPLPESVFGIFTPVLPMAEMPGMRTYPGARRSDKGGVNTQKKRRTPEGVRRSNRNKQGVWAYFRPTASRST
jgi:hypothetical protein